MESNLTIVPNTGGGLEKSFDEQFAPFQTQLDEWKEKAKLIVVESEDDTDMMAEARKARLALVKVRTGTVARHKDVKEEYLRTSQVIDNIKKKIVDQVIELENELEAKEKFLENRERERKAKLFEERANVLRPFIGNEVNSIQLAELSPMAFDAMQRGYKAAADEKTANELKEKTEREQREKDQREQQEKQQRENARQVLRSNRISKLMNIGGRLVDNDTCLIIQEGEPNSNNRWLQAVDPLADMNELEYSIVVDKFEQISKAIKDKAQKERERLQKLEQEKKDKANADRRLKRAPDRVKLEALAIQLTTLAASELPVCKEAEAIEIVNGTQVLLNKIAAYITKGVKQLEE